MWVVVAGSMVAGATGDDLRWFSAGAVASNIDEAFTAGSHHPVPAKQLSFPQDE